MPILFNVAVDRVVYHWMSVTMGDESDNHEGLGMVVGRFLGVFHADNCMIISKDP